MKNISSEVDYYSALPASVKREIDRLLLTHGGNISELHLKIGKGSSLIIGGERVSLHVSVSQNELESVVSILTGASLYAYRDSILSGYISAARGVRVGVVGEARYESGALIGISRISSLCFRIPASESSRKDELCAAFYKARRGLLIYSPPGAGKTSALRSLASSLAYGRNGLKIAVIDERLEFYPDDYLDLRIDLLRGYKKRDGLEIALRTLSPEVIMVDEIGSFEEAEAMLPYVNSGVKIVATAHASSYEELKRKKNLLPFFEFGVFDSFAGLLRKGNEFFCEVRCDGA